MIPRKLITNWLFRLLSSYFFLFFVSFWLPIGLHRVLMRKSGFWIFPFLGAAAFVGAYLFHYFHFNAAVVMVVPYFLLTIYDIMTIWMWKFPFEKNPIHIFRRLIVKCDVPLHMSMGVVVAVALMVIFHGQR